MLLKAENIVKQYDGHLALDHVNIEVSENSIHGLLGPNGAGKTTFIRIVNGITSPDSGTVFLNGKPLQSSDVFQMGYLPEERGLYKKMKVGDQVLYLAQLKGLDKQEARKRMKCWFEKFDMGSWQNRNVEELSKGMQQKVQFITTVLHEPRLLIFDEPFSGFDPVNADLLKQEILELRRKGATVIFSTHDMFSVEELCDDISLINKAKVVLHGKVGDIKDMYKEYLFVIKTQDHIFDIPRNNLFDVVSIEQKAGVTEIQIKKTHKDTSNNDLIRQLMSYCSILSFEEKLPTMNDVFIKTVKDE